MTTRAIEKQIKNIELGNSGEEVVARFLEKQNVQILEQNFRTKLGEIDIIAQKGSTLAFVEVKTRRTEYFDTSYVITKSKKSRLSKAARQYMLENNITQKHCRFDVAIVVANDNKPVVRYFRNAFYA
jgi:putative endonuclease